MAELSANERGWLQAIRQAEGTAGANGYSTTFGYQSFDPAKGHPRRVVKSGGYSSDAAGAYQFLSTTWDGVNRQMGTNPADFSPAAQDRAALQLIRNRGVDPTQAISREAVAKLAPEWASLPNLAGRSHYGQPVKGYETVAAAFKDGTAAGAPAAAADGGLPALETPSSPAALPSATATPILSTTDLIQQVSGNRPPSAAVQRAQQQVQLGGDLLAQSAQQLQDSAGGRRSSRFAASADLIQQILGLIDA